MTPALGILADLREVAPCPRCYGAHWVVRFRQHAAPLITEHGPLDAYFECPRTRQQVACRSSDYPPATPENIRAARRRIA